MGWTMKALKASAVLVAYVLTMLAFGPSSPARGATADSGAIAAKHQSAGGNGGYLGSAVTAIRCGLLRGGCVQSFRSGYIYWSPATGAQITSGTIGTQYGRLGWEKGQLGYPVNGISCGLRDGGCVQSFQSGYVYWSAASGVHSTRGAIASRWAQLGWEHGKLGYPVNEARCGLAAQGCVQSFQGGHMYWASASGANPVWGGIGTKWSQMGWESSPLGYPKTAESCSAGSCVQSFLGGIIRWTSSSGVTVVPSQASIGVLVNKRTPNSPVNRIPTGLSAVGGQSLRREAALQLQRLFSGAASAGVPMTAVSGYRSYAAQSSLYNSYVDAYGRAYADTISARAGYSEHQTGLTMDIGNPNGACGLQACFASTPAGSYAAANAWKYGFVIRYPGGYTHVTGYTYEPWHLRYIGAKVAGDMHKRGVRVLEQYLGSASAPGYSAE